MAMHYVPNVDPNELATEHVRWADLHANVSRVTARALTKYEDRRAPCVRIGYCSPRFGGGPLERFFTPVLQAHDRSALEITCYAFSDVYDEATRTMMAEC